MPTKRNPDATPFEPFFKRKPDISNLMKFGQAVHALSRQRGLSKFESRTVEAIIYGYGPRFNTYRCHQDGSQKIIITIDVAQAKHEVKDHEYNSQFTFIIAGEPQFSFHSTGHEQFLSSSSQQADSRPQSVEEQQSDASFNEPHDNGETPVQITLDEGTAVRSSANDDGDAIGSSKDEPEVKSQAQRSDSQSEVIVTNHVVEKARQNLQVVCAGSARAQNGARNGGHNGGHNGEQKSVCNQHAKAGNPAVDSESVPPSQTQNNVVRAPNQSIKVTQSSNNGAPSIEGNRHSRVPILSSNMQTRQATQRYRGAKSSFSAVLMEPEPSSYKEAASGSDAQEWFEAVDTELKAHAINQTWSVIPKPTVVKEISFRWVFKIKRNPDDSIEKYKARLVARGFSQVEGVDDKEIFAPVARMGSIRLFHVSICAQKGLEFVQFDIGTASLYGSIEEELYFRPPEGLSVPVGYTCKLNKSLYGLRRTPRSLEQFFHRNSQRV